MFVPSTKLNSVNPEFSRTLWDQKAGKPAAEETKATKPSTGATKAPNAKPSDKAAVLKTKEKIDCDGIDAKTSSCKRVNDLADKFVDEILSNCSSRYLVLNDIRHGNLASAPSREWWKLEGEFSKMVS